MKKVSLVRQSIQSECGLCCVSMVAGYYGFKEPLSFYRSTFRIGRDGTALKDLYHILEGVHLTPEVYKVPDIEHFEFQPKPYILFTKNSHFVVIKVAHKRVTVWDPSGQKYTISMQELSELSGGFVLHATPALDFKKRTNKTSEFRYVKQFFSQVKGRFSVVLLLSLCAYGISLGVPILLQNIVNQISQDTSIDFFATTAIVIGVAFGFFIVSHVRNIVLNKMQAQLFENISLETISHLLKIPFSYFDDRGEGNVLYRVGMLSQIQELISTSLVQVILTAAATTIVFVFLAVQYLFLLPALVGSVLFIGAYVFIANTNLMATKRTELAESNKVAEIQTEIVTTIFQIKSSRLMDYFKHYYIGACTSFKSIYLKSNHKFNLFNLIIAVCTTFFPMLILLLVTSVGTVSIGEIVMIYTLIGLLLSYSTALFAEISSIALMGPALHYINDVYDEKVLPSSGTSQVKELDNVQVSNLTFRYNDVGGDVLKHVSLDIHKGEKVALVGLSGSGKSTFIKLLGGLYSADAGTILINGKPLTSLSDTTCANLITIVPQHASVFNKSIRDNIVLDKHDTPDERVYELLELVNLREDIEALPMGIDTIVSSGGGNFSGGQCQRLAIARALFRDPQLLVLDEATNSLDAINESLIYRNLKQAGVTLLTVSHRLSTVKDANNIYVIDKGQIIETGQHDNLMSSEGLYASLYHEQQAKEKRLQIQSSMAL